MRYKFLSAIPVVMSFSAHDPSGGSGIQADIEAIGAMGCHCVPIITSISTQNTLGMPQFYPCPSKLVHAQAKTILEDIPVAVIKISALSSIENIRAVHQVLTQYPNIPVVFDPSLQDGNNPNLQENYIEALIALILPHVNICITNSNEAQTLAQEADTLEACAQEIMAHGAEYVLITSHNQTSQKWSNTFYGNYRKLEVFEWEKLEENYHGKGCTLSASLAGLLAQGLSAQSACLQAQEYTTECLKNGFKIGMGSHLPNRLFWARDNDYEYDFNQDKNHLDNMAMNKRHKK